MTRKFNFSIKTKLIVFLTVLCMLFSCLGFVACGDDNDVDDPNYSVETESDDVLIKNSSFAVNTYGVDLEDFPITIPTGWSKAAIDNLSASSAVNSGAVDSSDVAWDALLENLYADPDFLAYVKNIYNFSESDVIKGIRDEKANPDYEPKDEEIKEYTIKKYVNVATDKASFVSPGTSPEANDDYIYMLNNIAKSANYSLGVAQKVTSSSTVNMKKDKVYAISVWVKTANITGKNEFGANIRISASVNGSSQADYRISGIKDTEWTKYTIYVKPDATYSCTLTLVLGLGYGNGDSNSITYYTEGTAYFDDITIKELDANAFVAPSTPSNLVFEGEDPIEATLQQQSDVATYKSFASTYDLSIEATENNYFNVLNDADVSSAYTTSNITVNDGNGNQVPLTSKIKVGDASTQELVINGNEYIVNVNKASATLTIKDSSAFELENKEYALVSFLLKNELKKPAHTNVYIDVMDVYGDTTLKNASAVTVESVSEGDFTRYIVLIKNNFDFGTTRKFYLNIIVGHNDIASVIHDADFSTGSVTIKDVKVANGWLNNDKADEDYEKLFDFFTAQANATVALHAGYENDFVEDSSHVTYNFNTRPGNFGDILFNPTNAIGYSGIVPNHAYISNEDNVEKYTDTRSATGKDYNIDGVAGVINTKYLNNYDYGTEITQKLGIVANDDTMQLLMIKNNNANHYGFVGTKLSVTANAYAKVTVTLKVCDSATAYVYLCDVTGANKNVLTFNDFTVNTDVVSGISSGTEIKGEDLRYELKVTSDMMDTDGWTTVSFYVASGASPKSFRVEVWNGARDGATETASQGFVFIKDITTVTASGFSEGASWNSSFSVSGNPLYNHHKSAFDVLYAYERQLTTIEKEFNKEYPEQSISYSPNYVWAKGAKIVYGVYNTIDPIAKDPYADIEEEEEIESGCAAKTDPSTFWLSFSSILLAVVLALALIALIVKRVRAKRKANKSDALSHYKVTSRISKPNNEEPVEEKDEETSEEYTYGEVQSFDKEDGEKTETKE